jgi:tetratricopeptide (TPR) repeat protein
MLRNHNELRRFARLLIAAVAFMTPIYRAAAQSQPAQSERPTLAVAEAHLRRGNLAEAEKVLWSVLSGNPKHEQALLMLGNIRMRQQRQTEGVALFRRALEINPNSAVAAKSLAAGLAAQGNYDDALEAYRRAEQLDARDPSLKVDIARLYLMRKEFAKALSTLDSLQKERMPPAGTSIRIASLLGMGRKAEAIALTQRAKRSPEEALSSAEVFLDADLPNQVLSVLNSPVFPQRYQARVQYLRGCAFRKKRDLVSAQASFRRALAVDPKSSDTLLAMADIAFLQNRPTDGLQLQDRARALNPDSLPVLRQIVLQAIANAQPAAAMRAASELQQKSSALDDRYMVAAVMLEVGNYDPAVDILNDYVKERPQEARGWLGLAIAHRNRQRYPEAQKALETALSLDPNLPEAHYELGMMAIREGNSEEAMKRFKQTVEAQPTHAKALLALGTLYLQSGMLDQAQNALQRSLAANPLEPETEYQMSLLSNRLGKADEAKQHMERFHQLKREKQIDRQDGHAQTSKPS